MGMRQLLRGTLSGLRASRVAPPSDGFSLDAVKVAALEAFTAPVFIMRNGEIVFANRACCAAFGAASVSDITGHMITQRLADRQPDGLAMRASLDQFNTEFKAKGFVRRMWAFKRLDGSSLVVRSTVVAIPHATYRCSVAVVEDIDDFAAEQALRDRALRALAEEGIVKTVADRLTDTARNLTGNARELAASSDRASGMLGNALTSAETTASSAATIAAAARQLSANVDSIMSRMAAREARAADAQEKADSIRTTIASLEAAARRIDAVVELVGSIASQTQMLALNATIEAARAGPAGRGFAVVANEVKALAAQSAQAGGDIRGQVSRVQELVTETVAAIDGISGSIEELRQDATELSSDVKHQRDATHEIARNVHQSTTAASALTEVVRGLAGLASSNSTLSEGVLDRSTRLNDEAERLQDAVRQFTHR
jgi:PAS domain S-box-containing protein